MWLVKDIQSLASGVRSISPSAAFQRLEHTLQGCKRVDDQVVGAIVDAIGGAASSAWPLKLLQGTLDLLFEGMEGIHTILAAFDTTLTRNRSSLNHLCRDPEERQCRGCQNSSTARGL